MDSKKIDIAFPKKVDPTVDITLYLRLYNTFLFLAGVIDSEQYGALKGLVSNPEFFGRGLNELIKELEEKINGTEKVEKGSGGVSEPSE